MILISRFITQPQYQITQSSNTSMREQVLNFLPPDLRKVYNGGFQGHEHEAEMLKYILKNARALELIEICGDDIALRSKFLFLKKLSKFPTCSKTRITYIGPQRFIVERIVSIFPFFNFECCLFLLLIIYFYFFTFYYEKC